MRCSDGNKHAWGAADGIGDAEQPASAPSDIAQVSLPRRLGRILISS
jgi:hypothetical protein